MSEYCKHCETEFTEDRIDYACCDGMRVEQLEKENNDLKSSLLLIMKEIKSSNKPRIDILNDIMSISKKALKK